MNRRERRYGRMYLLPLLLALTGLALLPLEWVLRLSDFDAFGDLSQTVVHNIIILVYPIILMFLFLFRISPKAARVFAFISLGLSLAQLALILYCSKNPAHGYMLWVPGYMLLPHINALKSDRNAQNILLTASDICFATCNLSSVFTCLIYAAIKTRSEKRNLDFDRRYAYLKKGTQKKNAETEEPTRVVSIAKDNN